MAIYLISFVISAILLALADKQKIKIYKNLCTIIGLAIPCLLAGLRHETIGTDVQVYVKQLFEAASEANSFNDFLTKKWFAIWRYKYVQDFEIGFTVVVYLVTKIFCSFAAVLTAIHILIVLPIYYGLKSLGEKQPIWLGMLTFYFLFFNESLNAMRQWIAMAILIFAFHYLVEKKICKYIIFVCVAMLFHNSALIGFGLMLIYYYFQPYGIGMFKTKRKYAHSSEMKAITIVAFGCGIMCLMPLLEKILYIIGLDKYAIYISGNISLMANQIIIRLPILILLLLNWKSVKSKDESSGFYLSMIIIDLILSQLMSVNKYAFRIASYCSSCNVLSLSAIYVSKEKKSNRNFVLIYIVSYILLYWLYFVAYKGANETIPYLFGAD